MSRVTDIEFAKELDSLMRENPQWKVVDVGGGMWPYKRADYIVDIKEWGTVPNRTFGSWDKPYYNKERWIKHDICDTQTPFPFQDKFFDFSICMHTLEDIRNPIYTCHELMRISKRGYIETPSRIDESILKSSFAGYANHRWFVENKNGELVFTMKSHMMYSDKNSMCLPRNYQFKTKNDNITILWWDDSFPVKENIIVHMNEWEAEQKLFISKNK